MQYNMDYILRQTVQMNRAASIASTHGEQLSEKADMTPYTNGLTCWAFTRKDVEVFMAALGGGQWSKAKFGRGIRYFHDEDAIIAYDDALPTTCHVVKKRVVQAARPAEPESVVEVEEVECDVPLNSDEITQE
jgi:hypothetical protein